jgi:exodeoxyribonuclease VII large subunit
MRDLFSDMTDIPAAGILSPIFQVSEFNDAVTRHLGLMGEVTVEGEISRIDIKNNRLVFVTIKDSGSALDVFGLSHMIRNARELTVGMSVRVKGAAGLYKGSGRFRLMASAIEPVGDGALRAAFEHLKKRLEAEGLFDPSHKRSLPHWPKNIGLITALESSAYHDVVKILSARSGGLTIKVLNVSVQGAQALASLKSALHYCNQHAENFDVIIMCRGGGSAEDLAAFNDEELARLVFAAKVPLVSAIGHENNWSLVDYISDVRASTPSNAAELVVRDKQEIALEIDSLVSYWHQKLTLRLRELFHQNDQALLMLNSLLSKPIQLIEALLNRFETQEILLKQSLQARTDKLTSLDRLLHSLSYQNTLNRGYSLTKDENGKVIKDSSQVKLQQHVRVQLATGSLDVNINTISLP